MTKQRADELELPLMVDDNTSSFEAALTISTKARSGVTIGISAADRARMLFWRKQIAEFDVMNIALDSHRYGNYNSIAQEIACNGFDEIMTQGLTLGGQYFRP